MPHQTFGPSAEAVGIDHLGGLCDSAAKHATSNEKRTGDTPAETSQGVAIRQREAHRDCVATNGYDEDNEDFFSVAFGKVLRDLEWVAADAPLWPTEGRVLLSRSNDPARSEDALASSAGFSIAFPNFALAAAVGLADST